MIENLPGSFETKTYAFIDASNVIYGTRDDGWKVDFKKLFKYLKERYQCEKVYYFGGIEKKNSRQVEFYDLLKNTGYNLILKPVKIYIQSDKSKVRKANCDVDLTFYTMRDLDKFDRIIFLSGDGDFEILLKYLVELKKQIIVIANAKRTAKEIKVLESVQFDDLSSIRQTLELKDKKKRR